MKKEYALKMDKKDPISIYKNDFLYMEKSPIKKNITSEEVAKVAYFLVSDLSTAVTGQTIYVDNGFNIVGY